MSEIDHLEAEVYFLRTDEGGRTRPAATGYRPQFHYAGEDWDAEHTYPDVDRVQPGQTVRARIRFISPQYHRGRIAVGMVFDIREGARVVGRGLVTRVFDF